MCGNKGDKTIGLLNMLFKKRKKEEPEIEPIAEPQPVIEIPTETEIENNKVEFSTTDMNLAFSLQDKFTVKKAFFDKENKGLRTIIFNATKKEVEDFLREGKC